MVWSRPTYRRRFTFLPFGKGDGSFASWNGPPCGGPLYQRPWALVILPFCLRQSGAEADVRVRVRAGVVVAVAVEHTGIGGVVVVAAAVDQALYPSP